MITLVIHNHYTDSKENIRITSLEDLDKFAEEFGIGLAVYATPSRDLVEEAQLVAEYLSNHHLDVEIISDEHVKQAQRALKDLHSNLMNLAELMQKSDAQDMYDQYKPQLEAIAAVESSGHKRRLHPVSNRGPHKGTRSISSYGLMPVSIHWAAQKHPAFKNTMTGKLILSAGGSDADSARANWRDIADITEDQLHDHVAAAHMWDFQKALVSSFAPKDSNIDALTAHAHANGIGATREKLKQPGGYQEILEHPYVSGFLKYLEEHKLKIPNK